MAGVEWKEMLGWQEEHLEELRFAGFGFLREGKYDKAQRFFQALIILDPENPYDRQTLGALFLQQGKNEKAIEHLEKALQLDPEHEPTLLNKAKALFSLGKKPEALQIIEKLQKSRDELIANDAAALVLAHS